MRYATRKQPTPQPTPQPTATKCATCAHQENFEHNCEQHERRVVETAGRYIVLICSGYQMAEEQVSV